MESFEVWMEKYRQALMVGLLQVDKDAMRNLVQTLVNAKKARRNVWLCGNGGSGATAEHLAQDLRKQCGVRAVALMATPEITALGNDLGYSKVWSEQLKTLASQGDVLICLSGSGNSPNVIEALMAGNDLGLVNVAMVGFAGGEARRYADLVIHMPTMHMGQSEDGHMVIGHMVVYWLMGAK